MSVSESVSAAKSLQGTECQSSVDAGCDAKLEQAAKTLVHATLTKEQLASAVKLVKAFNEQQGKDGWKQHEHHDKPLVLGLTEALKNVEKVFTQTRGMDAFAN